jgi:DNA-binding SARP family transcriptional activator/exonuclease VII small subunit
MAVEETPAESPRRHTVAPVPHAKLRPPQLTPAYLPRERLRQALAGGDEQRLTVVTAGPGYGKSSLLAAWASEADGAWYTLDGSDRSLAGFARGLSEGLRGRLPTLRDELAPGLRAAAAAAGERARAESLAGRLCERLEQASSPVVLVLDDVQELEPGSAPARLLETLCRQAPASLRLVLASRSAPPFPVARLQGRGQVASLDAAALAFTEGEVAQLLAAMLGSAEAAEDIYALTAGWPAAVRLAVETLRGVPAEQRQRVLGDLHRPGGSLFRYLAEEVFAAEPPRVRELLRIASLFERVTVELCLALGLRGAKENLLGLASRGFFVQAEGGEARWFSVHALVREFVRERWPLSAERERRLYERASRWLESRGALDAALSAAGASGDPAELSRLLLAHGAELLARGSLEAIEQAAALIPIDGRARRIDEIVGETHALRGRWEEALACYERALGGEDDHPPRLASRIGRIHFDRGQPDTALEAFARGRLDGSEPAEEALLHAGTAAAELSCGSLERSSAAVETALASAVASGEPRALAAAHNIAMVVAIRSNPVRADEHYRHGLRAAAEAGDILQEVRLRSNYVAHLKEQGAFEQALSELEPAVRLAELAGAPLALAFALLKRGETRFSLGEVDLAIADFESARSLYTRVGSNRAFGALMELGEVYRERGDSALARLTLEQALQAAERAGDSQVLGYALANLARAIGREDGERASALAERAVALCRQSGHDLAFALLSSGWVALACGDRVLAAGRSNEAADATRRDGNRAGLAEALELQAMAAPEPASEVAWLEQAIGIWQEIGSSLREAKASLALARLTGDDHAEELAARRLHRLGVRTAGPPAGLLSSLPAADPAPVRIHTLGGFTLLRHGTPVPGSEWQSKKARDLLKLLVCRRGRPTTRDALIEALWPDDDPAKTTNRLSVALSTIRTLLDPEHDFPPDHFVSTGKDTVALALGNVLTDIEHFLADAQAGLELQKTQAPTEGRYLLEAAETAYRGDFLEEDIYHDWAAPLREEARAAYIATARALADLAANTDDHDTAIRYRLRILERDPYDEQAHLELVTHLTNARGHGEARRAYQTYTNRMEQIGVEPAPMPTTQPTRDTRQALAPARQTRATEPLL